MDVQMTVADVSQVNRSGESFHVQAGISDVSHFHRARYGFQNYIATQSLRPQSAVGRSQADEGGGWDQYGVFHKIGSRAAGHRAQLDAVAMLLVHKTSCS